MNRLDLDHVQIAAPANCEAAARRFYGSVLGLAEIPKPEALTGRGGCWFQVGERQLHISVEEPFRPSLKAHVAFATEDLVNTFYRLSELGLSCIWDEAIPNTRRFYTADPWGNRLEFTDPTRSAHDVVKTSPRSNG